MSSKYAFGKSVDLEYGQAVDRVVAALKEQGFGVLTEIDVAATLKKRLERTCPPTGYSARAIRNSRTRRSKPSRRSRAAPFAMLSCGRYAGEVFVEIMDPEAVMQLVGRPEVGAIAAEVRKRLERVLAAL